MTKAERARASLIALAVGHGCSTTDEESVSIEGPQLTSEFDQRPVVRAAVAPPPVYGGTLEVVGDGAQAAVADPERNRVFIVDLDSRTVAHELVLDEDDRPWRIAEDDLGDVHIVLRGSGQVLRVDPHTGEHERRTVCPNPRGIVAHASTVYVACAGGGVVALDDDGSTTLLPTTGKDPRDLVVVDGQLLATQFRSTKLERIVDLSRDTGDASRFYPSPRELPGFQAPAEPSVAWRTRAVGSDAWLMVHQYARPLVAPGEQREGAWGSGDGCNSGVRPAVTLGREGDDPITTGALSSGAVAVDVALSPNGKRIAVATVGSTDTNLFIFSTDKLGRGKQAGSCMPANDAPVVEEPLLALDYLPDGSLLALTRSPLRLVFMDGAEEPDALMLAEESTLDTGHDLFHRDAGLGLACASCHPEGADDGRIWAVEADRPTRTMPLDVDLAGTAPFHWSGSMDDFAQIVDEVFTAGMGGAPQTEAQIEAFEAWVLSIPPSAPIRSRDEMAIRGEEAFAALGCNACHRGAAFTQPEPVEGFMDRPIQVPLLVGVATRGPFMHDSRSETLRDAVVDMLLHTRIGQPMPTDATIDDVVAFLETL